MADSVSNRLGDNGFDTAEGAGFASAETELAQRTVSLTCSWRPNFEGTDSFIGAGLFTSDLRPKRRKTRLDVQSQKVMVRFTEMCHHQKIYGTNTTQLRPHDGGGASGDPT
jgi:hypothetical protein